MAWSAVSPTTGRSAAGAVAVNKTDDTTKSSQLRIIKHPFTYRFLKRFHKRTS